MPFFFQDVMSHSTFPFGIVQELVQLELPSLKIGICSEKTGDMSEHGIPTRMGIPLEKRTRALLFVTVARCPLCRLNGAAGHSKIAFCEMTQPVGSCFWIPIVDSLAATPTDTPTNNSRYPKVMKMSIQAVCGLPCVKSLCCVDSPDEGDMHQEVANRHQQGPASTNML